MTRRVFLVILSVLLIAVSAVGGELPQVLQPNATSYSAAEVTALIQEIAVLERMLENTRLGSRRTFAVAQWQSGNFAEYTAGSLSELGYETWLVTQAGWPDGTHTWVLVGLPLPEQMAWVPVEASPEPGDRQQTLGDIPSTRDAAGHLWFETSYMTFSEAVGLPPNLPPIAKLRAPFPPSRIVAERNLLLSAIDSRDPDGEIILYQWDFGDGASDVSTTRSVRHKYDDPGTYTVTVTVIDNRGKGATASRTFNVSSRGCGSCG